MALSTVLLFAWAITTLGFGIEVLLLRRRVTELENKLLGATGFGAEITLQRHRITELRDIMAAKTRKEAKDGPK